MRKLIYDYIWNGKPDKIKRTQIVPSYEKGDLKLTDIIYFSNELKSQLGQLLFRFTKSREMENIFDKELKNRGQTSLFKCNLSPEDVENIVPKHCFLKAWCIIIEKYKVDNSTIGKTIIWNSSSLNNWQKWCCMRNGAKMGSCFF